MYKSKNKLRNLRKNMKSRRRRYDGNAVLDKIKAAGIKGQIYAA
jgi:hypothetical protein